MGTVIEIWSLPDVLLYQISQFVAPKTARASFLCHTFALLNKAAYKAILLKETSGSLWELILHGDYGVQTKYQQQCSQERRIRRCKRLRRSSIESDIQFGNAPRCSLDMCFPLALVILALPDTIKNNVSQG